MRRTECIRGSRFHFDKNQRFFASIAADQIDFTASFGPEISIEHTKPISAEVASGYAFSSSPERQMGSSRLSPERSWPASNGK
jgi:hypothetical protein